MQMRGCFINIFMYVLLIVVVILQVFKLLKFGEGCKIMVDLYM